MIVTYERGNETHYGRIVIDVLQVWPLMIVRYVVETPERKIIDQTVIFCDWVKKPKVNYIINYFKNYLQKYFNPKIFNCPIEPGKFILAEMRQKVDNLTSMFSPLIPSNGQFSTTLTMKVKKDKKVFQISKMKETFEFF